MRNNKVKTTVIKAFNKNKILSVFLIFLIIGVVLASLIPPQILKYIIDYNFTEKTIDGLIDTAIFYIAILILTGILDFLKEAVLTVLGQKITKEIRLEMMIKLEKISTIYFSENETGQIVSRFTNDVDAINSMFTTGIVGMIIDCFKIIGIIISVFIFSTKLGAIVLILFPVIYALTRLFQKKMLYAQIENRKLVGTVNNHISESFKNIQMIKSFSKEDYMEKRYTELLEKNYETVEKVNFYDSVFSPIIRIIRAVVIASVVVLSSKQFNILGISLGMIAASIDLISSLFAPVENVGMELQNIQKSISGIKRVNEFFNETEDIKKSNEEYKLDNKNLNISFNNMSFHYEEGNDILKNINFEIKPNEKVTFVGRTGVGKSTLFKLAAGLLQPSSGNITINNMDVFQIPNKYKRNIFGYVEQNFHMIKGTVAEQISVGDENITIDQIKNALDFVGLTEYINNLENSYDTIVKNENIFSQGQKQLLSIARATVTNPPIMLLDEITANLDSVTEEKVVSVLQKSSEKHTILTISHRLSSMIASDKIVILENGRIKNSGTQEMLLNDDEWYRNHIKLEKLTWS